MKAERLQRAELSRLPMEYHSYASLHPYLIPAFGRLYWRRLDYCVNLLSKYLPPVPVRTADLGSGVGVFLRSLQARFPHATLVGLNCYPTQVLHAASQAWFREGGVQLLQGDVEHLPFPDASVDAVTALDVLEHVPDPCLGLAEIRRVLRPAGVLLVSVPTEGLVLRTARKALFLGRQEDRGADPHWHGTVRGHGEFWQHALALFDMTEGSFAPFGIGGPSLNYDHIALCHRRNAIRGTLQPDARTVLPSRLREPHRVPSH